MMTHIATEENAAAILERLINIPAKPRLLSEDAARASSNFSTVLCFRLMDSQASLTFYPTWIKIEIEFLQH